MSFNTFVAEVSCPKCQHPIMRIREDPRGVELPHCCDLYWVPKWKVVGGKLQFHLTYYRPEGMAHEKNLIHENEIQEDPQSTDTPPTHPKDVEHNVEHNTQNNTEHSDALNPTRPEDVEHNTQKDVEHSDKDIEHNDKAIALEFLSTHIVSTPEHFQTTDGIYSLYLSFAENQKSTPLEARKLYALLRERYAVEKTRRRVNGQPIYGFIGIRCDAEGL